MTVSIISGQTSSRSDFAFIQIQQPSSTKKLNINEVLYLFGRQPHNITFKLSFATPSFKDFFISIPSSGQNEGVAKQKNFQKNLLDFFISNADLLTKKVSLLHIFKHL